MSMSMLKRLEEMRDGLRACRDLGHVLKALDANGVVIPEALRNAIDGAVITAQSGLDAYNGDE